MVKENLIEDQMRRCIYFNGIMSKRCKAGVNYEDVSNQGELYPHRLPCLRESRNLCCEKTRFRTRAEAEEAERESEAAVARSMALMEVVVAEIDRKQGFLANAGVVPCPNCGAVARFTLADKNRHIRAACPTPNCASFIQ